MKTIFILCDTLNRRMLSAYGAGGRGYHTEY